MTEDYTTPELRAELARTVHDDFSSKTVRTPLQTETKIRLVEEISDVGFTEDATSFTVDSKLLELVGYDSKTWEFWAERGTGPFVKDELEAIAQKLDEQSDAWGPIGSEEVKTKSEDRVLQEPDPHNQKKRYKSLIALAKYGPGIALDIAHEVEEAKEFKREDSIDGINWSTVESELPRLYKTKMADRSKQPGFESIYTYWLTEDGQEVLESQGDWNDSWEPPHEDSRRVFGGPDE